MTGLKRFAGHGVLVTGAARGIGAAVARRLAEEGGRVLATDRDLPEVERTAARLRERGLAVEAYACDVADRDCVEAAVTHAVGAFGSLDVLVNCAAHCTPDVPLFEDDPDEAWARDLDVTLTGAYRCCRAALPHLGPLVWIRPGSRALAPRLAALSSVAMAPSSALRCTAPDAAP